MSEVILSVRGSYLESAKWVLLGEINRGDVVVEVTLASTPESLKLIPLGQDGVTLIAKKSGCRKSAGCVDQLAGLRWRLSRLPKQAS